MGRKKLYRTEEEKKQAQREHGLRYYYRRKALKNAQQSNADGGVVTVTVNEYSKKSFDVDKLEAALSYFNDVYGEDLDALDLEGPVLEYDRVKLNDIADYNAFMHCFLECLGEDQKRATHGEDPNYLWLEEN